MKQIFPKEIIENTVEVLTFKHQTRSKVIYSILLIFIFSILISLPFINVKIYTTARGIIKPDKERISLNVISSGKVIFSNISNNQAVKQGDTLLIIDNTALDEKIELTDYQIQQSQKHLKDLKYLASAANVKLQNVYSPTYQREVIQYNEKLSELQTLLSKRTLDFNRNKILLEKGVIASAEYENVKLEYDLALNGLYQFKKQQSSQWQAQLTELEDRIKEIENSKSQYNQNQKQYVILAPSNGTLLNAKGIDTGSFVYSGMTLAEISPDTDLLVECYISPSDIGLLKSKNKVNFQVDAFNYNQWGLATGKVLQIGKDIEVINNQPVFKVQCSLDKTFLQLKNGFKGSLGKGMALNARFELTQRSLYDLLYDKADDWLNPTREEIAINTQN